MRLGLSRRSVLLVGALIGLGCYSPTLPLPPPVKPEITETETGAFRVRGGVLPDAQIFMLNARTLLADGQQTNHLGSYDFELHNAEPEDVISCWYEAGTDLSPTIQFVLPDFEAERAAAAGGTGGSGSGAGSGGSASGAGGSGGTSSAGAGGSGGS